MGIGFSKHKIDKNDTAISSLKLPNVIDNIATKYILTSNFKDLENLHNVDYCNKLTILTSKIFKHHLNDMEIDYLYQRTKNGLVINDKKKEKIIYLDKSKLLDMDIKNRFKKGKMCNAIGRFYIKIAHIFAAITKTVNPVYSYINENGETVKINLSEKKNIDKNIDLKVEHYNLCSRRIKSLIPIQNNENGIILKPKNCNLNKIKIGGRLENPMPISNSNIRLEINEIPKMDNIDYTLNIQEDMKKDIIEDNMQEDIPVEDIKEDTPVRDILEENIQEENMQEDISEEPTFKNMTLSDEPGIMELETLYFDYFDFDTGKYSKMTNDTKKIYEHDVHTFYKLFTNNKKVPSEIRKFSDIKLKDFHNQEVCNSSKGPWVNSQRGTLKDKLFKKYADHLNDMIIKSKKQEKELLKIIDKLFVYSIDEVKKEKKLTIHPELTIEDIENITIETRNIILKLYMDCEKDFQKGLSLYENIVLKQNFDTRKKRLIELDNMQYK